MSPTDSGAPPEPEPAQPVRYEVVMAHPGWEHTALVSPLEPVFDTWEEALDELYGQAESWIDGRHIVVEHNGTFLVSPRHDPLRVTRLAIRTTTRQP